MNELKYLLELKYWGNTLQDYAWAGILFVLFWLILYVFQKVILKSLRKFALKTASPVDDFIALQFSKFGFFTYLTVSIFLATRGLHLSNTIHLWLLYLMIAVVTFRLVVMIQATVGFAFERAMYVAGEDARVEMSSLKTFNWLLNGMIWLIAILFLLSNLGINITSVIAGLGIGGIAIALAAQSILGDFFASLTILLDKPFRVGDTILLANDVTGTVEHIGVKTSRIRSLTGEQIIISNSDLTSSRIRNLKRMQERRVLYRFGIQYETPPELARAIPDMIREIVAKRPDVRFDRAHFAAFGDFALIYEVVYFVNSPDVNALMDAQQAINFEIMDAFAAAKYPFRLSDTDSSRAGTEEET